MTALSSPVSTGHALQPVDRPMAAGVTALQGLKALAMSPRALWRLVKSAVNAWLDDYAPSMGAALSYYTFFSLAPLLLIVISVAGLVFGADSARGAIMDQLGGMMGADSAKAIEGLLASASKPAESVLGTVVGVVAMLIGATTVFGELQDALDRIWRAPARVKGGLWSLLRARLLSFGMILGMGFLLLVSLVAGAAMTALGKWWGGVFGSWQVLAQVLNVVLGFVLTTALFALIYKLMPRAKVAWSDVWVGAVITSLLFTIGKTLIGLYIGGTGVASGYGAAGSIVIVLIWVYYSAQIFLLGAEFTWVYAREYGSQRNRPAASTAEAAKLDVAQTGTAGGAVSSAGVPSRAAGPQGSPRSGDEPVHRPMDAKGVLAVVGVAAAAVTLQRGVAHTLRTQRARRWVTRWR